ncbi:DUF1015 family protein, partial [candidate division GN15 bacterium]|nr:DUF1015 family protein [candidate division GN15 bacterium]
PYDVLNTEEARAMAKDNPLSFLRVNKPEINFPPDHDQYDPQVYASGKTALQKLVDDGVMVRDDQPCFYLYRLTWKGRSQTGLVCLTSVAEYDAGKIKKHEHTRPEKVNDRANHIMSVGAQVGPVFTTFRNDPAIASIFKRISDTEPNVVFDADDDVKHEMWVISDNTQIKEIIAAFGKLPHMYIADGHHRSQSASETSRRLREQNPKHTGEEHYNFFMNVLFPDSDLRILAYNRVVKDQNSLPLDALLEMAKQWFEIEEVNEAVEPARLHEFGLYVGHKWYKLTAKDGTFDPNDPVGSIDAAVLSKNFLNPILGIKDPRTDKRIDFVGGIRGTKELVRLCEEGQYKVAFSLYPTSISQLLDVADAGAVMPPKSTWFEPKLRSGLVVNYLTQD